MAGTPQAAPPTPQKPRLLCPVMSYASQQVPCVEHHCALWSAKDNKCSLITHSDRIEDGFERLIRTLHDIKAKI